MPTPTETSNPSKVSVALGKAADLLYSPINRVKDWYYGTRLKTEQPNFLHEGDTVNNSIVISKAKQRLYLYDKDGKVIFESPVSTGRNRGNHEKQGDSKTPVGKFRIGSFTNSADASKFGNTKFYGLQIPGTNGRTFGIHGDAGAPRKIGRPASHGCVRMPNEMLDSLFNTYGGHKLAGTKVYILDEKNNYKNGGRLITKYQTPAYGIYLTRPIKPDNAIEQVASTLGIGHAVMGIIDPKTGGVRFSQYGAHGNVADAPIESKLIARFKDPANPTEDEMRSLLTQYQKLSGDKNPNYTVQYIPGLNYENVINSMNANESGTGEFVSGKEYNPLTHNCGHYAAGLANMTVEEQPTGGTYTKGAFVSTIPSVMHHLIRKGVEAIPKYQLMPKGATTYKLNLNTTD